MIIIANEITVGFARTNLLKRPFLAHFENSRRSDKKRTCLVVRSGTEARHGFTVFLRIFKIAVNCSNAAINGSLELRETSNQNDELRHRRRRGVNHCNGICFNSAFGAFTEVGAPFRRLRAQAFQFADELAAESIKFADWQQHTTFEQILQLAELKRCAAEASQLRTQPFVGQWLSLGTG